MPNSYRAYALAAVVFTAPHLPLWLSIIATLVCVYCAANEA